MSELVIECPVYHPRLYEGISQTPGYALRQMGKEGLEKNKKPRLYHRRSLIKYVSRLLDGDGSSIAWSEGVPGQGFLTSLYYVNPLRAESNSATGSCSIIGRAFHILVSNIDLDATENIIGKLNNAPIQHYRDLEKHSKHSECPFQGSCQFRSDKCNCVWRPNQLLSWGKIENGVFVVLPETTKITSPFISIYKLKDEIREQTRIDEWGEFLSKVSKKYAGQKVEEIAAYKIFDNLQTMQRTDFHTMSCYGLPLHQAGFAIESCFGESSSDPPLVRVVINLRDGQIETKREAARRWANKDPIIKDSHDQIDEITDTHYDETGVGVEDEGEEFFEF